MSHELIKQLFEARLTQYAEANNYRVHYQNKRFEAKARETYSDHTLSLLTQAQ